MMTVAFLPERPVRKAATAVAHAPVPQACVMPEPRSHTRILILPSPNTWANSTLMRPGKKGWFSSFGPMTGRSTLVISFTKITRWGLPIDTVVPVYRTPSISMGCSFIGLPSLPS